MTVGTAFGICYGGHGDIVEGGFTELLPEGFLVVTTKFHTTGEVVFTTAVFAPGSGKVITTLPSGRKFFESPRVDKVKPKPVYYEWCKTLFEAGRQHERVSRTFTSDRVHGPTAWARVLADDS